MNRKDIVIAMLASAEGRPFSPVQIQKAIFLVSRNLPDIFDPGEGFNFVPYDYGPFDASVYNEANTLKDGGDVIVAPSGVGRWVTYSASDAGLQRGRFILSHMDARTRDYFQSVSDWVRGQSFSSLVKSIYEAYPDMRINSVFAG